jgi:hypothetical protein
MELKYKERLCETLKVIEARKMRDVCQLLVMLSSPDKKAG